MKKTTFVKKPRVEGKKVGISFADAAETTTTTTKQTEKETKPTSSQQSTRTQTFSTGLLDLDELYAGGLPSNTVLLLKEDVNTSHYLTLVRYFIAEGVASNQPVIFVTPHVASLHLYSPTPTQQLLESLPGLVNAKGVGGGKEEDGRKKKKEEEEEEEKGEEDNKDKKKKLKIAWRYEEAQSLHQKSGGSKRISTSHNFDLSKPISSEFAKQLVTSKLVHVIDDEASLQKIYHRIRDIVSTTSPSTSSEQTTYRIVIHSFGSPLGEQTEEEQFQFLFAFRSLIRQHSAVGLVTTPAHINSTDFVSRTSQLADTILALRSFHGLGEDVNEAFKEYAGFLYIEKLLRLGTLSFHHRPETLVYGFHRGRKRVTIEKLHLQPESKRFISAPSSSNSSSASHSHSHSHSEEEEASTLISANASRTVLCQSIPSQSVIDF